MTRDEEIIEAFHRGLVLIDEKDTDWWKPESNSPYAFVINPDTLDMNSTRLCILGQRYGGFLIGLSYVGIEVVKYKGQGIPYGFEIENRREGYEDFKFLTWLWAETIKLRRNGRMLNEQYCLSTTISAS